MFSFFEPHKIIDHIEFDGLILCFLPDSYRDAYVVQIPNTKIFSIKHRQFLIIVKVHDRELVNVQKP